MKYIIMAGGHYIGWQKPKHITEINGEMLVARTIRQLRQQGVKDIVISSHIDIFNQFGVPVLKHENNFFARAYNDYDGYWCDAFYPTNEPACYMFGDVVFSDEAIRTIVETDTDDIEFFASAPPFDDKFFKDSAEPFALKVVNTEHLKEAIEAVKRLDAVGAFKRKPIMWELWQVIKQTPLNKIDYTNYVTINDYTCDIDSPEDIEKFKI